MLAVMNDHLEVRLFQKKVDNLSPVVCNCLVEGGHSVKVTGVYVGPSIPLLALHTRHVMIHANFVDVIGILIILTGFPVYCVCVAWKRKPKAVRDFLDEAYTRVQKAMLVVKTEGEME